MSLSINQQAPTQQIIDRQQQKLDEKNEKLASGKRINRAADDAAGLQIASRLTSQINGITQQSTNVRDQINTNNVQAGQLSAIGESLQRASILSIQSGSPLNDASAIQGELDQLTEQVNTIAGEVLGDPTFLSSLNANDPSTTQATLENAFSVINSSAAALGGNSNSLLSQVSTYETTKVNVRSARSRIEDSDFAKTTAQREQTSTLLRSAIINKKDEESRKGVLINKLV